LTNGYEMGYMMGRAERSNPESIIGSKIDKEIEEIVKKKSF